MKNSKLTPEQVKTIASIVINTEGSMTDLVRLMIDQVHLGTDCPHCVQASIWNHYNKQVFYNQKNKPNFSEPMMDAIRTYLMDFILPITRELYPKVYAHLKGNDDLYTMFSSINYTEWVDITIDELMNEFDIDGAPGWVDDEETDDDSEALVDALGTDEF